MDKGDAVFEMHDARGLVDEVTIGEVDGVRHGTAEVKA